MWFDSSSCRGGVCLDAVAMRKVPLPHDMSYFHLDSTVQPSSFTSWQRNGCPLLSDKLLFCLGCVFGRRRLRYLFLVARVCFRGCCGDVVMSFVCLMVDEAHQSFLDHYRCTYVRGSMASGECRVLYEAILKRA